MLMVCYVILNKVIPLSAEQSTRKVDTERSVLLTLPLRGRGCLQIDLGIKLAKLFPLSQCMKQATPEAPLIGVGVRG